MLEGRFCPPLPRRIQSSRMRPLWLPGEGEGPATGQEGRFFPTTNPQRRTEFFRPGAGDYGTRTLRISSVWDFPLGPDVITAP